MNGYKDILEIWIGEEEGAKFWLSVCNDLSNRGVYINCMIHQIRNSMRYVSYKNRKEFMRDLKPVYKAEIEEIALAQLDEIKRKWSGIYDSVVDSWYEKWDKLFT